MGKTAIGWTDETWNPVRGCSRVSEGCRHCYAEQQAARIVRMGRGEPTAYDGLVKLVNGEPRWTGVVRLVPERLADPLRWRAPRRIFVNSMSDLFHESLTNEQIAAVFGVMATCPQHTFQVLTKRARRMREWFEWFREQCGGAHDMGTETETLLDFVAEEAPDDDVLGNRIYRGQPWPLPNVWLGVSTENQETYIERVRHLQFIPAAVHFISAEPLLGPIDMSADCINPKWLDWVIDGCESGPGARPADAAWFASLEEQCRAAGVAYFHKQQMIAGKLVHDFPGRQAFPEAR